MVSVVAIISASFVVVVVAAVTAAAVAAVGAPYCRSCLRHRCRFSYISICHFASLSAVDPEFDFTATIRGGMVFTAVDAKDVVVFHSAVLFKVIVSAAFDAPRVTYTVGSKMTVLATVEALDNFHPCVTFHCVTFIIKQKAIAC